MLADSQSTNLITIVVMVCLVSYLFSSTSMSLSIDQNQVFVAGISFAIVYTMRKSEQEALMAAVLAVIVISTMGNSEREHFNLSHNLHGVENHVQKNLHDVEDTVQKGAHMVEEKLQQGEHIVEEKVGEGVNLVKNLAHKIDNEVHHILDHHKTKPGTKVAKVQHADLNKNEPAINHDKNTFKTKDVESNSQLGFSYVHNNMHRCDLGFPNEDDYRTASMNSGENLWATSLIEAVNSHDDKDKKSEDDDDESAFVYNLSDNNHKGNYEKVKIPNCSMTTDEKKYVKDTM